MWSIGTFKPNCTLVCTAPKVCPRPGYIAFLNVHRNVGFLTPFLDLIQKAIMISMIYIKIKGLA